MAEKLILHLLAGLLSVSFLFRRVDAAPARSDRSVHQLQGSETGYTARKTVQGGQLDLNDVTSVQDRVHDSCDGMCPRRDDNFQFKWKSICSNDFAFKARVNSSNAYQFDVEILAVYRVGQVHLAFSKRFIRLHSQQPTNIALCNCLQDGETYLFVGQNNLSANRFEMDVSQQAFAKRWSTDGEQRLKILLRRCYQVKWLRKQLNAALRQRGESSITGPCQS